MNGQNVNPAPSQPAPPPASPKKKSQMAWVILIIILIVAGVMIWWWLQSAAPGAGVPVVSPPSQGQLDADLQVELDGASVGDLDQEFRSIDKDLESL